MRGCLLLVAELFSRMSFTCVCVCTDPRPCPRSIPPARHPPCPLYPPLAVWCNGVVTVNGTPAPGRPRDCHPGRRLISTTTTTTMQAPHRHQRCYNVTVLLRSSAAGQGEGGCQACCGQGDVESGVRGECFIAVPLRWDGKRESYGEQSAAFLVMYYSDFYENIVYFLTNHPAASVTSRPPFSHTASLAAFPPAHLPAP